MLRKLFNSVLILLIGAALGYGLLILAFSIHIPEEVYLDVRQTINDAGIHPRESLRNGKSDFFHEVVPDILDFGTDQLIVDYALLNPEKPLYKHALIEDYCRYWHGYVIFWRPFFSIFDIGEGRIANLGIQLLLAFIIAYKVFALSKKKIYSLAWLTIYFFMGPNSLACNLQYSSVYYVTALSTIVLLQFRDFFASKGRYVYLFLVAGMCTSYFDFLTYPMLSWAVPAGFFVALYEFNDENNKPWFKKWACTIRMIYTGIFWISGYLLFWLEKWLLGQILSDRDIIHEEVLVEVPLRAGITDSMTLAKRFESFWINWRHLSYLPFLFIIVVWVVWWIYKMFRNGFKTDNRVIAYAIMLFSSPLWYICGAEHTKGHHLYTWRVSLGSLLAFLMIVCLFQKNSSEKLKLSRKMIFRVLSIAMCFALGVALYSVVPVETQAFWNYDVERVETTIPPKEENAYVMNFTPRYSYVTEVSPLFENDSNEGYYEVVLRDNGKELYREHVSAEEYSKQIINQIDVDWHLKKGKTYSLELSTIGLDTPSRIWVVNENDRPEFVGNEETLQIRYTYHTPFSDMSDTIFYLSTWFAVFMALFLAGYAFAHDKNSCDAKCC